MFFPQGTFSQRSNNHCCCLGIGFVWLMGNFSVNGLISGLFIWEKTALYERSDSFIAPIILNLIYNLTLIVCFPGILSLSRSNMTNKKRFLYVNSALDVSDSSGWWQVHARVRFCGVRACFHACEWLVRESTRLNVWDVVPRGAVVVHI